MDLLKSLQAMFGGGFPASKGSVVSGDESLRYQESDLHKKNMKLREQLDEARERIVQLENQIYSMKEERAKVGKSLDIRKDEMDQMIACVTARVREVTDPLDEKLGRLETQIARLDEKMSDRIGLSDDSEEIHASMDAVREIREEMGQISDIKETIEQMKEQNISTVTVNEVAEGLKSEITEKVHAENVKCYRNIKSLVTDLEVKMEQMELGEESLKRIQKSFKGIKFFSFFSLLSFLGILAYYIMTMM